MNTMEGTNNIIDVPNQIPDFVHQRRETIKETFSESLKSSLEEKYFDKTLSLGSDFAFTPLMNELPTNPTREQQQNDLFKHNDSRSHDAATARVSSVDILLSVQKAQFGINMFDLITSSESQKSRHQALVKNGHTHEDAALMLFKEFKTSLESTSTDCSHESQSFVSFSQDSHEMSHPTTPITSRQTTPVLSRTPSRDSNNSNYNDNSDSSNSSRAVFRVTSNSEITLRSVTATYSGSSPTQKAPRKPRLHGMLSRRNPFASPQSAAFRNVSSAHSRGSRQRCRSGSVSDSP